MKATNRRTPPPASFTVGVMGSGGEEHEELARPLGELLARLGVNLLTGGGGGVMTSVSRAFTQSPRTTGICIGIIPCLDAAHRHIPKPGYPNPFVELPIFTHLALSGAEGWEERSRNHINVLSSNFVVALPGGDGTSSEVGLALRYQRPVTILAANDADVVNLPPEVPRLRLVNEVETMIEEHLRHRPATLAGIVSEYLPR